jgi:hypothetical protein
MALHIAVKLENINIIKLLISLDADVNCVTKKPKPYSKMNNHGLTPVNYIIATF